MTKNREQAEAAAAEWIARREREGWSDADEAALGAWIESSVDHRVAWLRLHTAWEQTPRLKSLVTTAASGTVPRQDELRLPFFDAPPGQPAAVTASKSEFRRPGRLLTLAASVLVVAAAAIVWQFLRAPGYHTGVGATQSVALPDGTRVTLNTNTSLRVEEGPTERRVDLERGEAFFAVAKDPSRPFVVNAGSQRIVAIGTQFSVRREAHEVRVYVTEGAVRIDNAGSSRSLTQGSATPETLLTAGKVARADADAILVREKPVAEVEQLLSWRSGYLVFDNTPLAEAVAEFNRYNERQVVIEDERLASMPIGGSFRITSVDAFVRLITSDLSIVATRDGDRIILSTPAPH